MSNISRDLRILARLAPRPVRPEEAATALGVEVSAVIDEGEALVGQGMLAFRDGGFAPGEVADDTTPSAIRDTQLAGALADALAARKADPADIGRLLAAAARWGEARPLLADAALRPGGDQVLSGELAALAITANEHAAGIDATTLGRLHLAKARPLSAVGRSAEAMEDLEVAIRLLDGDEEEINALGFATSVADNMQLPQRAETYAALSTSGFLRGDFAVSEERTTVRKDTRWMRSTIGMQPATVRPPGYMWTRQCTRRMI